MNPFLLESIIAVHRRAALQNLTEEENTIFEQQIEVGYRLHESNQH